ncbi:GrpB family protein [Dyadobacter psychrotolerans]|uniref:GrpB family protein n=1 Tax=Dyadobacter psychrotolerans TaxID=2541721 RepID=A0A4R5DCW0_9BACT|nr:GrpB family protein [Dyadobacter psychrotolerans]TDE10847.1 GrpB family protein [Dyadobacter psychrotolerans]
MKIQNQNPMLIEEYKNSWANDFDTLAAVILEALSGLDVRIEHVGSTAVCGLAAKPIIDMDLVYHQHADFEKVKSALISIGYFHNGNQGIADREVFKRNNKAALPAVLDSVGHHLYVCCQDSLELKKHILLRDYLAANKEAKMQYQNLKYQIALEANQDKKIYAHLKENKAKAFIGTVLTAAQKEKGEDQILKTGTEK